MFKKILFISLFGITFYTCSMWNEWQFTQVYLNRSFSPEDRDSRKIEVLSEKICSGESIENLKEYIKSISNIDMPNGKGVTPLIVAVQSAHIPAINALIMRGSKINESYGKLPPLIYSFGNSEVMTTLLEQGARIIPIRDYSSWLNMTYRNFKKIYQFTGERNPKIAEYNRNDELVKYGYDDFFTLYLHSKQCSRELNNLIAHNNCASKKDTPDVVNYKKFMIKHNIKISCPEDQEIFNKIPIERCEKDDLIKKYTTLGYKIICEDYAINAKDEEKYMAEVTDKGNSVMHILAKQPFIPYFNYLYHQSCDVWLKNKKNRTPLENILQNKHVFCEFWIKYAHKVFEKDLMIFAKAHIRQDNYYTSLNHVPHEVISKITNYLAITLIQDAFASHDNQFRARACLLKLLKNIRLVGKVD